VVSDPLAEMTRGLERGRAAIGVARTQTSA
jgi:hypothetical protein